MVTAETTTTTRAAGSLLTTVLTMGKRMEEGGARLYVAGVDAVEGEDGAVGVR